VPRGDSVAGRVQALNLDVDQRATTNTKRFSHEGHDEHEEA
jgi:hypothetical protein